MSHRSRTATSRRFLAGTAVRPAIVVGLLLGITGCDQSVDTSTANAAYRPAQRQADPQQCRDMIDNALFAAQPERFGVSSDAGGVVAMLNQWRIECGAGVDVDVRPDPAILERLFTGEQRKRLLAERYADTDAVHLRNAIQFRETALHVANRAENDLDRAMLLFAWVVRNVRLLSADDPFPSTGPFDAILFGQGRAEDRAWVFADLLRQVRMNAVVVRPGTTSPAAASGNWLLGVPLDGKLYLFDLHRGWPVPSETNPDTPFVSRPATLEEVLSRNEGPGPFAQESEFENNNDTRSPEEEPKVEDSSVEDSKNEEPQGETAPDGALQDEAAPPPVRLELIGTISTWAPRMARLQSVLTGDRFVVIHEALAGSTEAPGAFDRLSRLKELRPGTIEDIGIWSFPETTAEAKLTDKQRARLRDRQRQMDSPFGQTGGDSDFGNVVYGWRREHRDARLIQLSGDYREALAQYIKSRIYKGFFPKSVDVTPELSAAHAGAAEDGFFLSGETLLERAIETNSPQQRAELLSEAESNFRFYLQAEPEGRWQNHARLLFAEALVMHGDRAGAIHLLEDMPEDAAEYDASQVRLRRWRSLSSDAPMK